MDHIRGFKMYLEVAEGEELKRVKAPPPPLTPQLFESYLPAALALGVEQRWAERFADVLNVQAPDYLRDLNPGQPSPETPTPAGDFAATRKAWHVRA
jgi:hypothetical protein